MIFNTMGVPVFGTVSSSTDCTYSPGLQVLFLRGCYLSRQAHGLSATRYCLRACEPNICGVSVGNEFATDTDSTPVHQAPASRVHRERQESQLRQSCQRAAEQILPFPFEPPCRVKAKPSQQGTTRTAQPPEVYVIFLFASSKRLCSFRFALISKHKSLYAHWIKVKAGGNPALTETPLVFVSYSPGVVAVIGSHRFIQSKQPAGLKLQITHR